VAAAGDDPGVVLVGEAKLKIGRDEAPRLLADLERRAAACPELSGATVHACLWSMQAPTSAAFRKLVDAGTVVTAEQVVAATPSCTPRLAKKENSRRR